MKRLKNILIFLSTNLFAFICMSGKFKLDCILKKILGIRCPACGLTRSIKALLEFDIITSFKYNIFGPIIFILFIIFIVSMLKDIIKDENNTIKYTYKILSKYYYIIIICLIISMIINNIRKI